VARETRRQRRDARRAADERDGGSIGRTPPPRLRTAEAGGPGDSDGAAAQLAPAGKRRFSFLREVIGELRKVEWPNRAQVIQGTVVVIVACVIVGGFLYVADLVLKPFVQHVLL
jgi:preprotein translocase SecE subunit